MTHVTADGWPMRVHRDRHIVPAGAGTAHHVNQVMASLCKWWDDTGKEPNTMNRLRRTILISIAVLLASIAPATGFAAGTHVWSSPITATFHLHVQGRVSTGTTFWVAYGPLAGRWGIVRLHAMRAGLYEADALLPTGRTTIAYIQGHGLLHTRMGPVPGNPVVTIQRIGPMPISRAILQTVQWQMPVG